MSRDHDDLRRSIGRLRRTRDQLYLRVQLGRIDAREFWGDLETHWDQLEQSGRYLTPDSGDVLDGVVREHLTELCRGYDRLVSMLREGRADSP